MGDRQGLVWSLLGLGGTAVDLRDAPRAYVALSEAVAVVREVGDRWSIARALDGCAGRCGRVHR